MECRDLSAQSPECCATAPTRAAIEPLPPDDSDIEHAVLELLGGARNVSADGLIRLGIPLSAIDRLSHHGVNPTDTGIISPSALRHRRTQGKPLTWSEGDCLYRVGRNTLMAEKILGSWQKALNWLYKPRPALGGRIAPQAASTTPGLMSTEDLLQRLQHGFTA